MPCSLLMLEAHKQVGLCPGAEREQMAMSLAALSGLQRGEGRESPLEFVG